MKTSEKPTFLTAVFLLWTKQPDTRWQAPVVRSNTCIRGFVLIRRVAQTQLAVFAAAPRKDRQSVAGRQIRMTAAGSTAARFPQHAARRHGFRRALVVRRALSGHGYCVASIACFDWVLVAGCWRLLRRMLPSPRLLGVLSS